MPIHFWGECVTTAVYLINRLPTRLLSNITPFERLYGHPPTYDHLRVFGSLCYATIVKPVSKFAPCARRCVFLGYPTCQKGYKLLDLDSHKFLVSRDVCFHEHIFPYKDPPTDSSTDQSTHSPSPITQPILPDPLPSITTSTSPSAPRHSTRPRTRPAWHVDYHMPFAYNASPQSSIPSPCPTRGTRHPLSNSLFYSRISPTHYSFLASISGLCEPTNYDQAILDPKWRDAMQAELDALARNNT
ncbi:hypothetical protein RHGRI_013386 [Rhododendron griersonianum]|uniref:Retroviral polymerase SH3-like domain-containing protein n=1 Tax=Rhododendron griersonianum TaxID=479676 RepID=A0AAV6K5C3_9ERIC|nr:hypothetical protein RHGRI_013386 [Rhododendron griersonianum]